MGYPDSLNVFCIAQNYDMFNAYDHGCGAGVVRNRRFLGGVGVRFLTTLKVGFFVRLRMSSWIIFYITLLNREFLLKWCTVF